MAISSPGHKQTFPTTSIESMPSTMSPTDQGLAVRPCSQSVNGGAIKKIWIDLDNSPHVPFFHPIIEELSSRGYAVLLTARNSYQVCDLLKLHNLFDCEVIGSHWGKNRLLKILGTCTRTARLLPILLRNRPDLAVSHGSRGQILAGYLLRIPTVTMYDYEFVNKLSFVHSLWQITPEYLTDREDVEEPSRRLRYPGLKEDVYVPRFRPIPNLRAQLGIGSSDLMITVRPPATEAHYHNPASELLFDAAMNFFMERSDARVVLLPRNDRQAASLRKTWGRWISEQKIVIPQHAIDGLNVVWFSDLVVSGGGTMNREAAALGVPAYSIFRGTIGAVDRYLAGQGRLTLIESVDEVRTKIALVHRNRPDVPESGNRITLQAIVNIIVSILEFKKQPSHKPNA
jgi:predicted glycosyltransferase